MHARVRLSAVLMISGHRQSLTQMLCCTRSDEGLHPGSHEDWGLSDRAAPGDVFAEGMQLGSQRVMQRYIGHCNIQVTLGLLSSSARLLQSRAPAAAHRTHVLNAYVATDQTNTGGYVHHDRALRCSSLAGVRADAK